MRPLERVGGRRRPEPVCNEARVSGWEAIAERFRTVRALSLELAAPLSPEDQCIQSMPEASPTKWHLAHTTWFFETVILEAEASGYEPLDSRYAYLFNSYYEALGPRHPRPARGLLSRPALSQILSYRRHVESAMSRLFDRADAAKRARLAPLVELGINHEQQHQELMLTDIKHALFCNPLLPAYRECSVPEPTPASSRDTVWSEFPGGIVPIGHSGPGFAFDNESPRHDVLLRPYRLADRLVTCAEYLEFVEDGGYSRPEFWLSDGWAAVQSQAWEAPLYWLRRDGGWEIFTLSGPKLLDPREPVVHVSLYEAAAFADWAGKRLATEFEWEAVATTVPLHGQLLDLDTLHPVPAQGVTTVEQVYGTAWEWTRSSYDPYPGFRPLPGVAAEYNGKFMVSQTVLRGGSCVTSRGHIRPTYRNFFPPAARWQFSGIRLAEDA